MKSYPFMKSICLCFLVLTLYNQPSSSAQENISPIKSVEWSLSAESEETVNTETEANDDATESLSSQELSDESTAENASDVSELPMNTSGQLLAEIMNAPQQIIEYVSFSSQETGMDIKSLNLLQDADKRYVARMLPPYFAEARFYEISGSEVSGNFVAVDDLIAYAADALNLQAQIYADSPIEDFYVFTQENQAEIEGKVIALPVEADEIVQEALEVEQIKAFILEVTSQWLAREEVNAAFFETELGKQIDISGELAESFNQIARQEAEAYPELSTFFDLFEQGYEGTVTFDESTARFGIGLLYNVNPDQLAGIEMYVQISDAGIIDFPEEIIYSPEAFNQLVGFDVLSSFAEFEATLTPDMFIVHEE